MKHFRCKDGHEFRADYCTYHEGSCDQSTEACFTVEQHIEDNECCPACDAEIMEVHNKTAQ